MGKTLLVTIPVVTAPFERIATDIIRTLPPIAKKNRYILTIVEMATRYPEAIPLHGVNTESVLNNILYSFGRFGLPKEIISDRGTTFTSTLMKETARRLGISRIMASPYHSESNGRFERGNSTLKAMMRNFGRG